MDDSDAPNEPPPATERDPRYEMIMALTVANRELTPSEYKVVLTRPFQEWPAPLQKMLRPYGAEQITTSKAPKPWMNAVPDFPTA